MKEGSIKTYEKAMAKKNLRDFFWKSTIFILITIVAVFFLLPFFWMLSTSLKAKGVVFVYPPQWIPRPVAWQNYYNAWNSGPYLLFLRNTITIVILSLIGIFLSNPLVAFGFARLQFKGRDALFILVLATMMLPFHVTIVPTFVLFKYLKWIDTFRPLIVPAFFTAPFFVFLLRQFFLTIPKELEDAARIDGCGVLGIFFRIFLPLSKPVLATVGIFAFIGTWNDFLPPLIYLESLEKFTLQLGLLLMVHDYWKEWSHLMALSTLLIAPCIVLFFLLQRYIVEGITLTGIKR